MNTGAIKACAVSHRCHYCKRIIHKGKPAIKKIEPLWTLTSMNTDNTTGEPVWHNFGERLTRYYHLNCFAESIKY